MLDPSFGGFELKSSCFHDKLFNPLSYIPILPLFLFLETGSCYMAEVDLRVLLPHPPSAGITGVYCHV